MSTKLDRWLHRIGVEPGVARGQVSPAAPYIRTVGRSNERLQPRIFQVGGFVQHGLMYAFASQVSCPCQSFTRQTCGLIIL